MLWVRKAEWEKKRKEKKIVNLKLWEFTWWNSFYSVEKVDHSHGPSNLSISTVVTDIMLLLSHFQNSIGSILKIMIICLQSQWDMYRLRERGI
jgi:hypothetical protein